LSIIRGVVVLPFLVHPAVIAKKEQWPSIADHIALRSSDLNSTPELTQGEIQP
jgi:hypothetical protein